jgi:hypothetical protein
MDEETKNDFTERRYIIHQYRNTRLKLIRTSLAIAFSLSCLKININPNFCKVKIQNSVSKEVVYKTQKQAENLLIRNTITSLHKQKNEHNRKAYKLHLHLSTFLHHIELQEIFTHTENAIKQETEKIRIRYNLNIDVRKSQIQTITTDHHFHTRTVNET